MKLINANKKLKSFLVVLHKTTSHTKMSVIATYILIYKYKTGKTVMIDEFDTYQKAMRSHINMMTLHPKPFGYEHPVAGHIQVKMTYEDRIEPNYTTIHLDEKDIELCGLKN